MVGKSEQMSESVTLGVLLTLAGGFQDAYSYNCRGSVFANAQTGNIVLLGQNLAAGNISHAIRYLIPILAFLGGVYISEYIRHFFHNREKLHWRQVIILIEMFMLLLCGLFPQSLNTLSNIMMSFSCALQVNSFRKFGGIPCATTMCIGNMKNAAESLCNYHITKDPAWKQKSLCYYFIIFIFALGAAAGAVFTSLFGERSIWIAAAFLLAGFLMMFCKNKTTGANIG